MKDNVILTDFMGTGKTSLGKMLAVKLGRPFTEKFGGDSLRDTLANLQNYRARLAKEFGL